MDWTQDSKLIGQLVTHEDFRSKPYFDCCGKFFRECTCEKQGKLTIGVGRNIEDVGITAEEGHVLLRNDIKRVSRELDDNYGWWRCMTDDRQRVLIDMCFNMGLKTLSTFKNTLAAMSQGSYITASHGMLKSLWARQVGNRARRLAQMMRNG